MSTAEDIANEKKGHLTYRRDLIANRDKTKVLLVELIRYQDWPAPKADTPGRIAEATARPPPRDRLY